MSCLLALDIATFNRQRIITVYHNILLRYSQALQKHQIVEDAVWECPQLIDVEMPTQFQQTKRTVQRQPRIREGSWTISGVPPVTAETIGPASLLKCYGVPSKQDLVYTHKNKTTAILFVYQYLVIIFIVVPCDSTNVMIMSAVCIVRSAGTVSANVDHICTAFISIIYLTPTNRRKNR